MSRRLSSIDPDDGPIAAFAVELRRRRVDAKEPTLDVMAARGSLSKSAISQALKGEKLPSPDVLRGVLVGLECDATEVEDWLHHRQVIAKQLESAGPSVAETAALNPNRSHSVSDSAKLPEFDASGHRAGLSKAVNTAPAGVSYSMEARPSVNGSNLLAAVLAIVAGIAGGIAIGYLLGARATNPHSPQ